MDMPLQVSHWGAQPGTYQMDVTIGGALKETANRWPDRVALIEGTGATDARSWTFAALLETAEQVARALLSRSGPGSRVAVWSASRPEWVLLEFGAALAGATLVTVNPAYGPGEVEFVLAQSRADGLFVEPAVRSRDLLGIARTVSDKLPGLGTVVSFDDWDMFMRSAAHGPSELPVVHPTDPAQIQYTSGTTGFPKGALLTHVA